MRFLKKNPKIEGVIIVCGKPFDDDTVVFGQEYEPFADPKTFPGVEPRLVECNMDELDGQKLNNLKQFEKVHTEPPPRHLGGTTSANFHMHDEGARIHIAEPIRTAIAPTPEPMDAAKKASELKKVDKALSDLFTPESMMEVCPGINSSSSSKILAKFKYAKDLAEASNVDLRAVGIRTNYFIKVRTWAKTLLE